MGDISDYIRIIQNGTRGEDVRDAIDGALKLIFRSAKNTKKLGGKTSDQYAKFSDLKPFAYDNVPTEKSESVVRGAGIYSYFGDGKNPETASSDSITGKIQSLYRETEQIATAINNKDVPWSIGNPILEYGNAIRRIYQYKMTQLTIKKNGTYESPKGELWNKVIVNVKPAVNIPLYATKNDKYVAESGFSYSPVTVDVPTGIDFEYDKKTHKGVIGVLFYDGGNTATETESKYKDLLDKNMSLDEIYKVLTGEKSSVESIFKNMIDSGFDPNSIISVFLKNGNTSAYITSLMKKYNVDTSKIFNGLFNSSQLRDKVNDIISSLDVGGKFNVNQIAEAIKNSDIVRNSSEALDDIKKVLETDPTTFSTFDSAELLAILNEE